MSEGQQPSTCHKLIKVQKKRKTKKERKDKDEMEDSQEKDEELKDTRSKA